jgi:hypothetical protein
LTASVQRGPLRQRPPASCSAATHEPPDGGHHLLGSLILPAGLGADNAGVRVRVEQTEGDLVEGRVGGPENVKGVKSV